MSFKQIFKYVLIWRVFLTFVSWVGIKLLPFKDSFPYREELLVPYGSPLFYTWANFDGVHYLGIAKNGYFAQFTQAFFPLYPTLIRFFDLLVNNLLLSGLILSHVFLVLGLNYLSELVRLDYGKKVAQKVVILLLVFPTSFFFGSLYTESLFLLLIVGSFYAYRVNNYKEAILLSAFASATRIIGVFMLPSLLHEHYLLKKNKLGTDLKHKLRTYLSFLSVGFSASGLVAYMTYLHRIHGDALYFLSAQPAFGAERSSDKIILLYQVIYRYVRMILSVDPYSLLFYTVNLEFWSSIIALILLCVAVYQKMRPSYLIFSFGAYFLPTLTGTFSSMPRYVLLLFPIFIVMAQIRNKWMFRTVLVIFTILLIVNTILFTRGYWVA